MKQITNLTNVDRMNVLRRYLV